MQKLPVFSYQDPVGAVSPLMVDAWRIHEDRAHPLILALSSELPDDRAELEIAAAHMHREDAVLFEVIPVEAE